MIRNCFTSASEIFAEQTGMTPLIYDWESAARERSFSMIMTKARHPMKLRRGSLQVRSVQNGSIKIRGGKMIYGFESDTKIDDEILKQELGNNGDVKLKNIVRTIQKEQNAIIRNTEDKILVIQGGARKRQDLHCAAPDRISSVS